MSVLRAIHAGYRLSLGPTRRRFERAARAVAGAQEAKVRELATRNARSAYGRMFSFETIRSAREWQDRVPIVTHDELAPWVQRAADGEPAVLTTAPIRIFERTSGSTASSKLVPYTDALLAEFGAATGPWLHDLHSSIPQLRGTTSYWSVSPATRVREFTRGGVPIGFEDDTEYFGPIARAALRYMLAVPPSVARIRDVVAWRAETARYLVAAADLGLVSVWHPSFLVLLLREIEQSLDELLAALPATRAREITARLGNHTLAEALWPSLAVVSCWADAAASDSAAALKSALPNTRIQPKGLLATEGVVSFPLLTQGGSRQVAAVTSHFLEFIDLDAPTRRPSLAHELRVGATYSPVLSTGGGFYRYRLGDAVQCDGHYHAAPVLRFVGRVDHVSDICGEKLSGAQVDAAVGVAARETSAPVAFALLAPSPREEPPRYRLYLERRDRGEATSAAEFRDVVERELSRNPGYAYARTLGQLAELDVVMVRDGVARHQQARAARGERLGNVKPSHLDTTVDWDSVFNAEPAVATETIS